MVALTRVSESLEHYTIGGRRSLPEAFMELAPPDPDNPPRPKAAKLARGLPASFDTCWWIQNGWTVEEGKREKVWNEDFRKERKRERKEK